MKAAEHETTRRNVRPNPNILPIQNPRVLSCLQIDRLCTCQIWKFQSGERMKLTK